MQIPVMTLGIRRYTNDTNRSFAYSLFYAVMNVAALLSGWLVDLLRHWQDALPTAHHNNCAAIEVRLVPCKGQGQMYGLCVGSVWDVGGAFGVRRIYVVSAMFSD